jgi:hypothetical protein
MEPFKKDIRKKSIRRGLEKKAKEFEDSAVRLLEAPACFNSSVGRYYYSMYIRVMQISNILNKESENKNDDNEQNSNEKEDIHIHTIGFFVKKVKEAIKKERVSEKEKKEIIKTLEKLRLFRGFRNRADYSEKSVDEEQIKQLKYHLEKFNGFYEKIIKILDIESKEID